MKENISQMMAPSESKDSLTELTKARGEKERKVRRYKCK